MLQAIRDKVTGWIAYGIIFLISIPFALWGVNSYLGGGEVLPAAIVNGEEITQRIFDQEYANYRQRLAQLFGGTIPESFGGEDRLREQVLGQIIEEIALRQYTQDHRYRIGDTELNRMIRSMEVFHTGGQFDPEIYQAQLRSRGYSPLAFEEELRRGRAIEQFQTGIRATAFTLPVSDKKFTGLNNQTRKIRTLNYRVDRSSIRPDASEIEQHYQTHAIRFRTPAQVKIDFIELSLEGIKQSIEVDSADAFARYQENLDAYSSPEVREASHILIKAANDEENQVARAQIDKIRERIIKGESFADLAREYSQDPGSSQDGGNLGEIERGMMVQAFETALFALTLDQLSEPVKTAFGWHLIRLHTISGGEVQSFEAVQATLEDDIKTELAEGQIYDLVEIVSNLAYEQSDSLLPVAEQLDLTVQTSDWFDNSSGTGIAAEQKIRAQAFSQDVLTRRLNSEAIEIGTDRVVFIRLNQHKPPAQIPRDEIQDRIETELINLKARELSQQIGSNALTELISGKSLENQALEWSATINDRGFVGREQPEVDAQILRATFSMPKPEQAVVFEGLSLAAGDYAIIELSAVVSSDANVDQKAIDAFIEAQAGAEYQSVLKLVSSRAEVVRTPLEDL